MMKTPSLYLDRMLYPVTALGPGNRLAFWVSGCSRHCERCASPFLWQQKPEQAIPLPRLLSIVTRLLRDKKPDGLTITGGEPFDQALALSALLQQLPEKPDDILIYSGYSREELLQDPEKKALLAQVGVLIDGPYLDSQNTPDIVLRGSRNQRIFYEKPSLRLRYQPYLQQGRQIQNFIYDYEIFSVGIQNPMSADL